MTLHQLSRETMSVDAKIEAYSYFSKSVFCDATLLEVVQGNIMPEANLIKICNIV